MGCPCSHEPEPVGGLRWLHPIRSSKSVSGPAHHLHPVSPNPNVENGTEGSAHVIPKMMDMDCGYMEEEELTEEKIETIQAWLTALEPPSPRSIAIPSTDNIIDLTSSDKDSNNTDESPAGNNNNNSVSTITNPTEPPPPAAAVQPQQANPAAGNAEEVGNHHQEGVSDVRNTSLEHPPVNTS